MSMEKIFHYFPSLTKNQKEKFSSLYDIYLYWNERINLISRKDFSNFYEHHVLHSLAIARFFSFKKGQTVLDVGTGGGFPGIPLAIFFPKSQFFLLDSIQKKLMVVDEVSKHLDLKNVETVRTRIEEHKIRYDFVTGRAVKRLPQFVGWTRKNLKYHKGSIVYLSGGNIEPVSNTPIKTFDISSVFHEPFFDTKKVIQIFPATH